MFGSNGSFARSTTVRIKLKKTYLSRIKEYFEQNPHKIATAKEISEATGVKQAGVGHILYKANADLFQPIKVAGTRVVRWRLKQQEEVEEEEIIDDDN